MISSVTQEREFAADEVADPAEHERAERTHREADGEGRERLQEIRGRVSFGIELRAR